MHTSPPSTSDSRSTPSKSACSIDEMPASANSCSGSNQPKVRGGGVLKPGYEG